MLTQQMLSLGHTASFYCFIFNIDPSIVGCIYGKVDYDWNVQLVWGIFVMNWCWQALVTPCWILCTVCSSGFASGSVCVGERASFQLSLWKKKIENHESVVSALSSEVWGAIKDFRNWTVCLSVVQHLTQLGRELRSEVRQDECFIASH